MTTVVFDISMSLDGYVTAAHQTAAEPMGKDGLVLHDWWWDGDPASQELRTATQERYTAYVAGRTTYDHSLPWWQADGPSGRRPVFVVTHEAPARSPEGGVYEFVTGGIEEALERAKAAAGGGVVEVMSASLARQFIEAGLLDEIVLHVVPVLFGGGTRLFDDLKIDHTRLEQIDVVRTALATHLRYRVVKPENTAA
ncbi:dihydrofolate reductase family protein [Actinophytocola sp.]|uniref:dihydrofolate reductase family protein n=1 Tax=Actinophytocola sp. TaxID=1872138 RepID=UPI002EDA24C7